MSDAATAKRSSAARARTATKRAAGADTTDSAELSPALTDLGAAFRRVFRAVGRLRGRDTHLGGAELTHAQFELLSELYERGALPAGELAAAARLTPASVTQMLDHLAACGHVERVRSETDRRVVVSRLTDDGRAKIEAKRAAWQSRWQEALGNVSDRDLRAAARVLEQLGTMFEDVPADAVSEPRADRVQAPSQGPR
jgi:DNA-binding MarR family transcriptional regulator